MLKILRTIARISVGLLFVFSGYVKVIDPIGSQIKFGEYFEAFSMHGLIPVALIFGIILSVGELLIGLGLLFGLRMKQVSWAALLFMIFMTGLTFVLAVTDAVKDCGCFGDAIKLTNRQTFYKNLIILPVVIFIFAQRKKYKQIMCCTAEWITAGTFAFLCTCFLIYNYRHLPFIDFMPYKCGVNIPEAMIVPENAPKDVFEESTFIYEKNGERKTFTLDDLPDETWTFIDAPAPKLLKAGYSAPARDFTVSRNGEHIQNEILEREGYLVFVTSYNINGIKDKYANVLKDVYEYCTNNNIEFVFLSGSSERDNDNFKEKNDLSFDIYFTDETVLKSMVRSNPGLMLLKDGTILKKRNILDVSVSDTDKAVKDDPKKVISEYETRKSLSILISVLFTVICFAFFSFKAVKKAKQ